MPVDKTSGDIWVTNCVYPCFSDCAFDYHISCDFAPIPRIVVCTKTIALKLYSFKKRKHQFNKLKSIWNIYLFGLWRQ